MAARRSILEDIQRAPITYDRLLLGATALGRALTDAMPGETHVALLLPNAVASVVTLFGLQAFGVVPCLLNVTAGAANMLSACRAAGAKTVVSSSDFVEKGRLDTVVERLAAEVRFIWLEDVRDSIGLRAKLRAKRDAWRRAQAAGRARVAGLRVRGAVHQRLGGQSEGRRARATATCWPTARSCRR